MNWIRSVLSAESVSTLQDQQLPTALAAFQQSSQSAVLSAESWSTLQDQQLPTALAAFQQPSQSVQDINAASGAKHKLHCRFCNKTYRSSKRLAQHMYGHTGLSWTMQKGGGFSGKLSAAMGSKVSASSVRLLK